EGTRGGEGPPKKSRRLLRQPAELTYRFIAEDRDGCPVAWACEALEVSESGHYAWADRTPSQAQQRRDRLVAAIRQIDAEMKGRYGSPRMTAELNARGHDCTGNPVAHLMRTHGIRAKPAARAVRPTASRHAPPG